CEKLAAPYWCVPTRDECTQHLFGATQHGAVLAVLFGTVFAWFSRQKNVPAGTPAGLKYSVIGTDMTAKATRIDLFSLRTPQMRAFHLTWLAFFVCFYAWFACAPLMPVLKGEFNLTPGQIANINIAAVAVTILVRLIVGPLCD